MKILQFGHLFISFKPQLRQNSVYTLIGILQRGQCFLDSPEYR